LGDFDFHGSENSGIIRGTGDISGTADTDTHCKTTFSPPAETTLTTYRKISYTIAKSGQSLYLLACTAHWKPTAGTRFRAFVAATSKEADSQERAQAVLATGAGHWSDCPAFGIGDRYALRIHNASEAWIDGSAGNNPIKLEYLGSSALSVSNTQPQATPTAHTQPQSTAITEPTGVATALAINSTPSGADIQLDGNFVGNTPSTLRVQPGKHYIVVKKQGFQDWVREMAFSGGNVTLNAELVAGSATPSEITPAKNQYNVTAVPMTAAVTVPATQMPPGWIGVSTKKFGAGGALIVSVVSDGPASKGGLKTGDVITQLNGINIGENDFDAEIAHYKPGSTVRIGYMRNAWAFEATLTVSRMPM
jgi:hypothetical protein